MESNTQQSQDDADQSPIKVVNGEAKPSGGNRRKIFMGMTGLILIVGFGFTGFLYSNEKSTNETLDTQLTEANSDLSSLQTQLNEEATVAAETSDDSDEADKSDKPAKSESTVPEGYKEYINEKYKFKMYYPKPWGDLKPKAGAISGYKTSEAFGPEVKYEPSSKQWIVTNVRGFDNYSKGQHYNPTVLRKDRVLSVYDFGVSEGGCTHIRLVFTAGKNMIEASSKAICVEDKGNYTQENLIEDAEEVAHSIEFL